MNPKAPLLTTEPPHAEAIARWEAFWHLEDLDRPLWVIPTPPAETLFEAQLVPMQPLIQDKAFQLRASLNFLLWREALAIGDDWVSHLQAYQEYIDYFVAETGGRYPTSTYLQGPMDMAYLVWDSSAFMLAMYRR